VCTFLVRPYSPVLINTSSPVPGIANASRSANSATASSASIRWPERRERVTTTTLLARAGVSRPTIVLVAFTLSNIRLMLVAELARPMIRRPIPVSWGLNFTYQVWRSERDVCMTTDTESFLARSNANCWTVQLDNFDHKIWALHIGGRCITSTTPVRVPSESFRTRATVPGPPHWGSGGTSAVHITKKKKKIRKKRKKENTPAYRR